MKPAAPAETVQAVGPVIAAVASPANFFTGRGLALEWQQGPAEESWEIYRGRLLDVTQTRQRRTFECWNAFLLQNGSRSGEPLLSVKLDAPAGQVHVVRGVHSYVWEGYDAGGNVVLSRETTRWVRELVASFALADFSDLADLHRALADALFRAVVGTSRLPLTSLEAPLPAFVLGQLAYFAAPTAAAAQPMRSFAELIERSETGTNLEAVKLLETLLRATPIEELGPMAELLMARRRAAAPPLLAWLRGLFDEVSLSPYTDFVDKTLRFLHILSERGDLSPADHVDFCSFLLRHLSRHLTAYDLVQFHHMGANYPDALLLDAVLKTYLELAERFSHLFMKERSCRIRRRALRQGWLLRRLYEGHPVPAAPTSPGENTRVLPPQFPRVPDEQIYMPHRRPRRLYADDPLHAGPIVQEILQQSIADLEQPAELQELGTGLFIDRPFSMVRNPGEPDGTLLLSYVCFSNTVAHRRLDQLVRLGLIAGAARLEKQRDTLAVVSIRGLALTPPCGPILPGRASLADTFRAGDDFQVVRTTRRAADDFLRCYPLMDLRGHLDVSFLKNDQPVVILREDARSDRVQIHDSELRKRLELQIVPQDGKSNPALRVLRAWDDQGCDLGAIGLLVHPRLV